MKKLVTKVLLGAVLLSSATINLAFADTDFKNSFTPISYDGAKVEICLEEEDNNMLEQKHY